MAEINFRLAAMLAALELLASCTLPAPTAKPTQPPPAEQSPSAQADQGAQSDSPSTPQAASGLPEKPLASIQKGAVERFDCLTGTPDWHARIAFEAHGGEVLGFAYYSKWRPRTCSIDLARNAAGSKWSRAPDGAVRVDTPQGRFHIRTHAEAYEFQFVHVQRRKFCGMPGEINGTMTVKRVAATPQCSATGIMDTNDPYLDALYKSKR